MSKPRTKKEIAKCPICGNPLQPGQTYCSKICEDMGALDEEKSGAPAPIKEPRQQKTGLTKFRMDKEAKKIQDGDGDKDGYPNWTKLTDYIRDIWPEPVSNWQLMAIQIKNFIKTYNLTCDDIRAIIRYAVEYDGAIIDPEYGLGQFIPKYIEPTTQFVESIQSNWKQAKDLPDDEVIVSKPVKQSSNVWIKLEDF